MVSIDTRKRCLESAAKRKNNNKKKTRSQNKMCYLTLFLLSGRKTGYMPREKKNSGKAI